MTLKQIEKSVQIHDQQIKAIRDLMRAGMQMVVKNRQESDARMKRIEAASDARMKRIEAALELHITGKRSNGKGPVDAE